jgi:hypothetical protein
VRHDEVRSAVWTRLDSEPDPNSPIAHPDDEVTVVDWSNRPRRVELVSFEAGGVVSRPEPPPPPQKAPPKRVEPVPQAPVPERVVEAPPVVLPGAVLVPEEEVIAREDALIAALQKPYRDAAARFIAACDELERRLREDVVDLAARIASAMLHRELKMNRGLVLEVAQRALRLVGPLDRVTVKCASEDADLLREHMPNLARTEVGRVVEVTVRPSDDVTPGGLVLTFEGGVVDAREDRRLARITDAVKEALHALESDERFQSERSR